MLLSSFWDNNILFLYFAFFFTNNFIFHFNYVFIGKMKISYTRVRKYENK